MRERERERREVRRLKRLTRLTCWYAYAISSLESILHPSPLCIYLLNIDLTFRDLLIARCGSSIFWYTNSPPLFPSLLYFCILSHFSFSFITYALGEQPALAFPCVPSEKLQPNLTHHNTSHKPAKIDSCYPKRIIRRCKNCVFF